MTNVGFHQSHRKVENLHKERSVELSDETTIPQSIIPFSMSGTGLFWHLPVDEASGTLTESISVAPLTVLGCPHPLVSHEIRHRVLGQ